MTCSPGSNISDDHSLSANESTSALLPSIAAKLLYLLLLIPIVAVLGNLLIIASVARFQNLRTPTNAFVVSLAVADFLVAVLVMPFSLVRSIDVWHFGRRFCQVHFLLDVTFCTSSIFNLSCVALERYVAVCDPLHYPTKMSPRRVTLLLVMCWLLPLLISSLCVSQGMYLESPIRSCSPMQQENNTCLATFHTPYALASSTLSFFIPVGFMLFAYGKIFLAAQKQARWIHAMEHHAGQLRMDHCPMRDETTPPGRTRLERSSLKRERKAAKTLGLIMGVFLLCWFPFFFVNMVNPLWRYTLNPAVLEAVTWLGYANSSLNPLLYASFNKNYRHSFAALLGCGILGRLLRSCLQPVTIGRQTHTVLSLETITR